MGKGSRVFFRSKWLYRLCVSLFVVGFVLLGVNVYGLSQSIRKPDLGSDSQLLRFVPDNVWSYEKSIEKIENLKEKKSYSDLAEKANYIVNKSLVHPKWFRVDPYEYRQLIPLWENPYLYAIGEFSSLPQFNRYHFADYERSIERGIGICGDASMVLSSILDKFGVSNRIVSFKGHVIVEYKDENGRHFLLDPDFGVVIGRSLEVLVSDPQKIKNVYYEKGYSEKEVENLVDIYKTPYSIFDDTYHFMTKRYWFEYATYIFKWLIPVLLVIFGLVGFYFLRGKDS
ncbi:hypothetical protein C8D92_102355 [Tamilnaduibacter salinus]|uniref:Transglutaminase-like domain-containing protein n=1 Tax=Tamilnaduibacter salinus TaxID=1484056 RepID=A0A2U1D063_9GAMM|nr:hypothetical protein [Tamilnaduibacter salinus]PVY78314.1 hypothetical protein C8D92_102355 [Tamilnaduibacter salinus]